MLDWGVIESVVDFEWVGSVQDPWPSHGSPARHYGVLKASPPPPPNPFPLDSSFRMRLRRARTLRLSSASCVDAPGPARPTGAPVRPSRRRAGVGLRAAARALGLPSEPSRMPRHLCVARSASSLRHLRSVCAVAARGAGAWRPKFEPCLFPPPPSLFGPPDDKLLGDQSDPAGRLGGGKIQIGGALPDGRVPASAAVDVRPHLVPVRQRTELMWVSRRVNGALTHRSSCRSTQV